MTELYAIYGVSGCGRSLMPVAREHLARCNIQAEIVFIDDALMAPTIVNGHTALNYSDFKKVPVDKKHVLIAIANSKVREKLANQLEKDQIALWSVQANSAIIMDEVLIAPGAALSPFVTVTSYIKIG